MSVSNAWGQSHSENYQAASQSVWGPQADVLGKGYAGMPGALDTASSAAGTLAPQVQRSVSDLLSPQGNPYLSGMARAAMQQLSQGFSDLIAPTLRGDAVEAGGFGSPEAGNALGVAARGVTQQMADVATNIYGNAYQSDRQTQLGAIAAAPGASATALAPYQAFTSAVGPPTVLGSSFGQGKSYAWNQQGSFGL
jgi:hypothetical protein